MILFANRRRHTNHVLCVLTLLLDAGVTLNLQKFECFTICIHKPGYNICSGHLEVCTRTIAILKLEDPRAVTKLCIFGSVQRILAFSSKLCTNCRPAGHGTMQRSAADLQHIGRQWDNRRWDAGSEVGRTPLHYLLQLGKGPTERPTKRVAKGLDVLLCRSSLTVPSTRLLNETDTSMFSELSGAIQTVQ